MVSFAYLQVVYILKKWFDYYENSCQFFWKFKFLSYYYYAKNSEKIVPPYYSIWFYFSLLLPCFWSLFVMFYSKILPFFSLIIQFFSRKNCRKTLTQKGNQKVFPSVPSPYFMSTLRMMMLNGWKIKYNVFWHISLATFISPNSLVT